MLDRQTVQKLPLDIIQNLEWLKLNSERNRERVDSVRKPARVFLQEEYDELTRNFGKSVVLGKKVQSCSNSLERPKEEWKEEGLPLAPEEVLIRFSHYLTRDEKVEIKDYDHIYYIGHKLKKRELIHREGSSYDNEDYEYKCQLRDHIAYRYELIEYMGKGSYGQVFKVFDHKKKQYLALKIIKNKKKYTTQAQIQIKILTTIREYDPDNISGIVKIKDFVVFRKHVVKRNVTQCIVFELLCQNLYELIKRNNYNGLDMQLIRRFAIQILNSLKFLKQRKIIHCDLKPQNILLKHSNKSGIKIIDFGSSCFQKQIIYSYIQSRYYRAPEVTLEIRYDTMIDMWSFGCILAELYIGAPLFPGDNQFEQVNYLVGSLGLPPLGMVKQAQRANKFFNEDFTFTAEMKNAKLTPGFGRPLKEIIQPQDYLFLQFLEGIIKWDPKQRPTPQQALRSPWILEGLPDEVKNMHRLFNEQPRSKRSARIGPNQSKQLKKKSKSRDKDSMADSKSKSKSRSKQISVRTKQTSKNQQSLKRQSHSIPVKIKLNLQTKVKVKGDGQPKIHIQINKAKKSKEFFRER